jgi:hypothetical protein
MRTSWRKVSDNLSQYRVRVTANENETSGRPLRKVAFLPESKNRLTAFEVVYWSPIIAIVVASLST